ncbi:MAG: NAD(P)/FAD-dependent oxidoreductase [Puniceicoccaceae bacterium]|nr:MAG: NAD(P)/FAD-dependent oxidoreductase [Puniceicoccaceae bacterium]
MSTDVAIVGSGHNGLITAAYLAKAGHKVEVFERRPVVGGAVCTQSDLIPGYKIDVGSSAHVMIHQTPVLRELELDRFGLEYIEMDPWACYPLPDGSGRAIFFHKDIEKTCQSIAQVSPADADQYRKFCEAWGDLNEGVFQAFLRAPTPMNLVRGMVGRSLKGSNRTNMVRQLMAPYGQVVCEWFEHEALRTAMIWLAAQSGPPPSEPGSGDFAGWHSMYHRSGMKRAKGGSGALTQALKARILADGGLVHENAPVRHIRTTGSGRVRGVETEDGTFYPAKAVVAACHIKTTVETLLSAATDFPDNLRLRTSQLRIGNGFGMIVRCAVSELPRYTGIPTEPGAASQPCHRGLQLLCPSRQALDHAYADYLAGRPPEKPLPLAMTFSAIDPTIAPEGKHTLFIWGQYHPYELANGETWDDIREREADKLIAAVDAYAPGVADSIIDRYIQTPLDIERLHGLHRGNVMHLEMSLDQMFTFRPMPELSSYKVPSITGLYLTGASTHPGGGVWGASGHNTAKVVLKEHRMWR